MSFLILENPYWSNNGIGSGTLINHDEYDEDDASNSHEFNETGTLMDTTAANSPMFTKLKQTTVQSKYSLFA